MKRRLLAIILTLAMLLSTAPAVFAANESDVHQELVDLACEIFPEYENKILYQKVVPPSVMRSSEVTLVHSESRSVSDSQTLQYSEYSNGLILLTDAAKGETEVTYIDITGNTKTTYTMDITATCSQTQGAFVWNNIRFTTFTNAYDQIDSIGSYYPDNPSGLGYVACSLVGGGNNPSIIWTETASRNAEIEFKLIFRFAAYSSSFYETHLTLYVGGNGYMVAHNVHN